MDFKPVRPEKRKEREGGTPPGAKPRVKDVRVEYNLWRVTHSGTICGTSAKIKPCKSVTESWKTFAYFSSRSWIGRVGPNVISNLADLLIG